MKENLMKGLLFTVLSAGLFFAAIHAKDELHPAITSLSFNAPKDSIPKVPTLNLTGDHKKGEKDPILSSLKIDVKIIGTMATTTMDMSFFNENNRVLEGELIFPLAEGQSISRFALEVNGNLREAAVVDKNLGQKVYEEVIRQKVDPGLVEHVQGNSYRVRVYPLPAKGNKRLVLAYEQELTGASPENQYYLPLDYKQVIKDFALHIEVAQQKVIKNSQGVSIEYKELENKTIADLQQKDFNANSFLSFAVPQPTEAKAYIEKAGDETYFFVPVKLEQDTRKKKLPSSVCLYWDASGSGNTRDKEKELKLLRSYFEKAGAVKLRVIVFANKIIEEKQFNAGNFSEVENYLKNISYDGATNLNVLDFNQYPADEIILVSDGLGNYGTPATQNSKSPIITITSAQQSDFNYLKFLGESTGGNSINLNTMKLDDALKQMLTEPLRLISVSYHQDKNAAPPSRMFHEAGAIIQNNFSIAGIASSKPFELNIIYGYGNEKTGETSVIVDPSKAAQYNGLVKRVWAQKKLQQLLLQQEKNKEIIIECAVENKIVTPFTSLLVLDRLEDYVRYKITPPSEFKTAYDSAMTAEKTDEARIKKEQLEKVIRLFNERKTWWEKDFTKIQEEESKKPKSRGGRDSVIQTSVPFLNIGTDSTRINASGAVSYEWNFGDTVINSTQGTSYHYSTQGTYYTTSSGRGNASVEHSSNQDNVGYRDEDNFNTDAYFSSSANGINNEFKAHEGEEPGNRNSKTVLKAWEPNMPYLEELKKVPAENLYSKYLEQKKKYGTSPSFYLDVTDLFLKQNKKEEALRILSNLAEIELKNYRLLRVLAHKLEQTGSIKDAIELYRQVMELRKEEPQSYRDLGLALAKNNQKQEAIEVLYKITEQAWDARFPEIEVTVIGEINNIIACSEQKLNYSFMDPQLIKAMPVEARVILNWDADNCDIDLWVTDPRGEKCYYGNRNTKIGGRNSPDYTGGYGPEEFIIKSAMKGKYKVEINYYGTREQTVLGPTTIQVEMYTNYGKPNVKLNEVTRRLNAKQETIEIGSFIIE